MFQQLLTLRSLVLHEYLAKYSTPEEAAKHPSEALVSMQHFEDAVKKKKFRKGIIKSFIQI